MPGIAGRHADGSSAGGEHAVGVDDDAAAADPGHATRIGSPLRKRGNRRPGAGEGLPLCLGLLVATLLELPLASAEGMGYWSATDVHWDLKAIAERGARLGMGMSWRGPTRRAALGSGATLSIGV